jgi:hypothetical protein
VTSRQDAFARSYVATGYLLGSRAEALSRGLGNSDGASALCEQLSQPERAIRAQVLAGELTTLARALAEHRLA